MHLACESKLELTSIDPMVGSIANVSSKYGVAGSNGLIGRQYSVPISRNDSLVANMLAPGSGYGDLSSGAMAVLHSSLGLLRVIGVAWLRRHCSKLAGGKVL